MMQDGITRTAEIAYVVLILAVAALVWREAGACRRRPTIRSAQGVPDLGQLRAGGARPCHAGAAPAGALARPRATAWWWVSTTGGRARAAAVGGRPHAGPRVRLCVRLSFRGVGFLPATAVYLFLSGAVLGPLERRRLTVLAVFAVAAAVVLDLLFRRVFRLDLT